MPEIAIKSIMSKNSSDFQIQVTTHHAKKIVYKVYFLFNLTIIPPERRSDGIITNFKRYNLHFKSFYPISYIFPAGEVVL